MYNPVVGFDNNFVLQNIPKVYREENYIAWIKGLLSQSNRLNLIFNGYINGTVTNHYDSSVTYNLDEDVIFNYQVYKSLKSANLNNSPDSNPDFWQLISKSFIGLEERSKYRANRIVLEYALNRFFSKEIDLEGLVGFRQPDDPVSPTNSDIYIENEPIVFSSFILYRTEPGTSFIFSNQSSGYIFEDEIFANASSYLFNVNIPIGVYNRIGTPDIADTVINNFLDRYVPAGIKYKINTY